VPLVSAYAISSLILMTQFAEVRLPLRYAKTASEEAVLSDGASVWRVKVRTNRALAHYHYLTIHIYHTYIVASMKTAPKWLPVDSEEE
jgi:hypothetical protein